MIAIQVDCTGTDCMPSKTRTNPGKAKSHLAVRFVIRVGDDEFTAECLDAGAIGIGQTKSEAIRELIDALEALFEEHGAAMKVPPTARDAELLRRLEEGGASADDVVAWGRIERHESFDVSSLTPAMAA
jgi:hypothetical protein